MTSAPEEWLTLLLYSRLPQVLDHLVIQKLNAEGRLEKKETNKNAVKFDKVGFFGLSS